MTDIEVRFPDRKRASSSFSAKKPVADVSCTVENGRVREIVVPVRVGRILQKEGIDLPREEQEAFDLIHAIEGRVCMTMLTEMLSRRDHAIAEVRTKLKAYGFRDQEIDAAITQAEAHGFLNDERFVRYFVEERKRRGWGRRKVEVELRRKGIDLDAFSDELDDLFVEDDDRERVRALLNRKRIPDTKPFEKLVRHLMSKGFSYALAADAVRAHLAEFEASDSVV